MFKKALIASSLLLTCNAIAQSEVPITGNVASKCVITTDTPGVFGQPTTNVLSTLPADGGVTPIVRYDIIEADAYKAQISVPNTFTTSPVLNDVVNWTGSVEVNEVSNSEMAAFETNKVLWDNVTEFDLTLAGSVWFKIDAKADYGYDKSFPGGIYRASVLAECIAK
jgi:hypothetical protein